MLFAKIRGCFDIPHWQCFLTWVNIFFRLTTPCDDMVLTLIARFIREKAYGWYLGTQRGERASQNSLQCLLGLWIGSKVLSSSRMVEITADRSLQNMTGFQKFLNLVSWDLWVQLTAKTPFSSPILAWMIDTIHLDLSIINSRRTKNLRKPVLFNSRSND